MCKRGELEMKETLLHTPEGVRDVYGDECRWKNQLLQSIHHVLHLYSYHDIETPSFEYFNIFNMEKGSAHSNEMYKFFDRENNTLVLRPDFTPSVARCVAKYYADEELPIRLCYQGKTFRNTPQHQGKPSIVTQAGCELINDDSSAADAEVLSCVIDCLKASGLTEFQIVIGEVDYFRGMMAEAGIGAEEEEEIRDLIQIRNFFGLSEYVTNLEMPEHIREALSGFDRFVGGLEILEIAEGCTEDSRALNAIDRLRKVYSALSFYGYDKYINIDLGMLNGYDYYTGIVFSGYTYGTGAPVVKGGRYNNLMQQFGKDAPAIGFAIDLDSLMTGLNHQQIIPKSPVDRALVVYPVEFQEPAVVLGKQLRNEEIKTELIRKSMRHALTEYLSYADRNRVSVVYYFLSENRVLVSDRLKKEEKEVNFADLLKEEQ
ncbi:MAG: ATP phosphoribosyltransferase regulatory subunit [Eubacterium sp.]|nr:ATP phosphoribosyltransferase regulatory subunit [Eubacterium sp.]